MTSEKLHGTTVLCVIKEKKVVMVSDGQVTLGSVVLKGTAKKVMKLEKSGILVGFAGSVADALILLDLFEKKLVQHSNQMSKAAIEMSKDWRTDKMLRRLDAMLIMSDGKSILCFNGTGEIVESESKVFAIGSGGSFALSAATALIDIEGLSAHDIAMKSMNIAGELCIYTNKNFSVVESDIIQ